MITTGLLVISAIIREDGKRICSTKYEFSLSNSFTAVSNFLTLDKIACFANLL